MFKPGKPLLITALAAALVAFVFLASWAFVSQLE
jgi:hypothetical protein